MRISATAASMSESRCKQMGFARCRHRTRAHSGVLQGKDDMYIFRFDAGNQNNSCVVTFSDTDEWVDWLQNLDVSTADVFSVTSPSTALSLSGHAGLINAYNDFRRDLWNDLVAMDCTGPGETDIIFTGYSRSAGISAIAFAALHEESLLNDRTQSSRLVTWGAPRVFHKSVADRLHEQLQSAISRYVFENDPISQAPPTWLWKGIFEIDYYEHFGNRVAEWNSPNLDNGRGPDDGFADALLCCTDDHSRYPFWVNN